MPSHHTTALHCAGGGNRRRTNRRPMLHVRLDHVARRLHVRPEVSGTAFPAAPPSTHARVRVQGPQASPVGLPLWLGAAAYGRACAHRRSRGRRRSSTRSCKTMTRTSGVSSVPRPSRTQQPWRHSRTNATRGASAADMGRRPCIAGDNFYDRKGDATAAFYDQLTLQAKSKIMLAVPGNHDYCARSPAVHAHRRRGLCAPTASSVTGRPALRSGGRA